MIIAGGQAVDKGAPAPAQPLNQPTFHEQIKDPVNRHAIDRNALCQNFVNFSGRQREVMAANDLQNTQAVSRCSEITGRADSSHNLGRCFSPESGQH